MVKDHGKNLPSSSLLFSQLGAVLTSDIYYSADSKGTKIVHSVEPGSLLPDPLYITRENNLDSKNHSLV